MCETAQDWECPATQLLASMQASLDLWEGGLRATGGALVPDKSHWYFVLFRWNRQGKFRYATPQEVPAVLLVRGPDGQRKSLERLHPSDARRTLGVRLAIDGNMSAEFTFRKQQGLQWADKVRAGRLPKALAWLHFTTSILRSFEYPLPATTFSQKQCHQILSPVLSQSLASCGIIRSFARALAHGPIKYQGLGIPNLWHSQGIAHLCQILTHGCHSSITGQLLRTSLECLILELGRPGNPFDGPLAGAKAYVTPGWWLNTWDFMDEYLLSLSIGDTPLLRPLRDNDRFLMPAFERAGYSKKALRCLSICRCYLQVTTLAEITDGFGTTVAGWALEGVKHPTTFRKIHCWPGQPRPGSSEWQYWAVALRHTFSLTSSRQLPQEYHLGLWHSSVEASWFYDPNTSRLLHLSSDGWRAHSLIPTRRSGRHKKFHYSSTPWVPPARRLVCAVSVQVSSCIFMDSYMEVYSSPSVQPSQSSLPEYFQ